MMFLQDLEILMELKFQKFYLVEIIKKLKNGEKKMCIRDRNVTMELIDDLKEIVKKEKITEPSLIKDKLIELMNSKLASKELNHDFNIIDGIPTVSYTHLIK